MTFIIREITLSRAMFYKGLAISMILLHNFFHWLPPAIGENEQNFSAERLARFLNGLMTMPDHAVQILFSYMGHYGVQIFLFLSAYGLTKRHLAKNKKERFWEFFTGRLLKIYPPFLFSILIWLFYYGFWNGDPWSLFLSTWKALLLKISLFANFYPGQLYSLNGPWWFVSLIVQFYLFFPGLMALYERYGEKSLWFVATTGVGISALLQPFVGIWMHGTVFPHLPEISLGIAFAFRKEIVLTFRTLFLLSGVFILGNIYHFFWYGTFAAVTILLLLLFQWVEEHVSRKVYGMVLYLGFLSMYLFYLNGFMRHPWIEWAKSYAVWYMDWGCAVCFFMVVVIVSIIIMKGYEKLVLSAFSKA